MTWQHLVTLLLVMAASHLATPEGVTAATTAWETPPASLYKQGGGASSHGPGETVVDVTGNNNSKNRNNNPRDPQPDSPTPRQHQQQQQQKAPSTPARQEHPRGKATPDGGGVGEAGGHDSSVVDTVLAALVDYSKDPELWRNVHSVVDELDFSQRASHPPAPTAPRQPRPALHLTQPHAYWWGTAAGAKQERDESDSHTHRWCSGCASHGRGNASGDRGTTTTTTTISTAAAPPTEAPQLSWLQQPPEEPPVSVDKSHDNNASAVKLSVTRSDRVNFIRSQPSPPPHFLFHRVFVNETFDSHTRQPYRRPVLALTAVGKHAAKANIDNFTNSTNHTRYESTPGAGAKELTDKYYLLSENIVTPKYSSKSSKGKETTLDAKEEHVGGVSDSRDVVSSTHHQHHHDHHQHHHHHHQQQHHHHHHRVNSSFYSDGRRGCGGGLTFGSDTTLRYCSSCRPLLCLRSAPFVSIPNSPIADTYVVRGFTLGKGMPDFDCPKTEAKCSLRGSHTSMILMNEAPELEGNTRLGVSVRKALLSDLSKASGTPQLGAPQEQSNSALTQSAATPSVDAVRPSLSQQQQQEQQQY